MNTISIMGRLTRDPKLAYTKGKDPIAYCQFSVAVRRNQDVTDFIDCTAWGATAELVEKHFMKGYLIGVTGALHIDPYEDKDGNKRRSASIEVRSIDFCDSPKAQAEPEEEPENTNTRRTGRR